MDDQGLWKVALALSNSAHLAQVAPGSRLYFIALDPVGAPPPRASR